ncbi:hypothetical protein VTP01DRAFT_9369 [Rhizomucor pusillus]|uniref:uncharacterized protein n=1 Tax=Rhizomucor pusillus TaxID=4840 RepID=UPI00374350A4
MSREASAIASVRSRNIAKLFRILIRNFHLVAYGFVEFDSRRDAREAMKDTDGMYIDGVRMIVERAKGAVRRGSDPNTCFRCDQEAEDDIKARDILHAQGPRTAALYDPEVTRVHEHHLGQGTDVVATHTHLAAEVEEEGKEEETTTAVAPEADTIDTLGPDLRLLDVEQDRVPESGG